MTQENEVQSIAPAGLIVANTTLAWLAGVLDADGSIGLASNKFSTYLPQVQLTNTDHRMLDRVRSIYEALGVNYRIGLLKHGLHRENHAMARNPCVGKQAAVHLLLERVGPWLLNQFDREVLLSEFCRLRIAATKGGKGSNAEPYGEREHQIYLAMKSLQTSYKVYGESYGG